MLLVDLDEDTFLGCFFRSFQYPVTIERYRREFAVTERRHIALHTLRGLECVHDNHRVRLTRRDIKGFRHVFALFGVSTMCTT